MKRAVLCLTAIVLLAGCAYMGMHGPSIQLNPDTHEDVADDADCLECHGPEDPTGPPTHHPRFTGCLACHNDPVDAE